MSAHSDEFRRRAKLAAEAGRADAAAILLAAAADFEPPCVCGHHSHDHYSDPTGMAASRCWHADTYDALDYPADGACNCRDYTPQEA